MTDGVVFPAEAGVNLFVRKSAIFFYSIPRGGGGEPATTIL